MSYIEETLVQYLNGVTALATLVGTRIYPGVIPQGSTFPLISFYPVGGGPRHSLSGITGLEMRLYRFDVWAEKDDKDGLLDVSQALQTALDGYRGTMGTTYALVIQRIMLNDIRDEFEPDSETLRRVMEFAVDYNP